MSVTPAEFRGSRVCFVATGVLISITAVVWSWKTTAPVLHIWVIDGTIVVALPFLLAAALIWINGRQRLIQSTSAVAKGAAQRVAHDSDGGGEARETPAPTPPPAEVPPQPEHRSPIPLAVEMYRASTGATRAVAKLEDDMARLKLERPYVVPELVYNEQDVCLFVENVGVRAALEVSIDPIGNPGISRMTFDPVPLLSKTTPRTEVNPRFSGGDHPQSIADVLHLFSTTTIVQAHRLAQTIRGQEATVRVPLVLRYHDALADMTHCDVYEFVSKVPTDGKWILRLRTDSLP